MPAVVFLLYRHLFLITPIIRRIWTSLSFLALTAVLGLFIFDSSTVVDRLALYLIPLQLFVGSRLPDIRLFGLSPDSWNQLLIFFSFTVLTVWLFFAGHSFAWLPYRNLLLPL